MSDPSSDELPSVYIGEGDNISARLKSHAVDQSKDFWDRFVAFTSKDLNLTKAHVKYLEARLIELIGAAKKCTIENKTSPNFDLLPEADKADMETYLEEIRLILPVIGINLLPRSQRNNLHQSETEVPTFVLNNQNKGINACAREFDGIFMLLKGSLGSLHETVSFKSGIKNRRDTALKNGTIEPFGDKQFKLVEDIEFSSPSGASVFLHGTSRNGRSDWIVKGTNTTYGIWQNQRLTL